MMKIFLIVLGCIILAWLIYLFFFRKKKLILTPRSCFFCDGESAYGYSEVANDMKTIRPVCRKCLISRLEQDYSNFSGRAVVIQPISGPPCYAFHSNRDWSKSFKGSKMDDDVRTYLLRMDTTCQDCGQRANFLWIGSSGLTKYNFGNVLRKGFAETLLPLNPHPVSLCRRCCVRRIDKELEDKEITYLEVLGPRGKEDGFIMPMAY
jgi:hypothetical protein